MLKLSKAMDYVVTRAAAEAAAALIALSQLHATVLQWQKMYKRCVNSEMSIY